MSVGIMSVVWAKAGQIRPVPTQIICGVLLLEAQVCFELMFLCVCVVVCVCGLASAICISSANREHPKER